MQVGTTRLSRAVVHHHQYSPRVQEDQMCPGLGEISNLSGRVMHWSRNAAINLIWKTSGPICFSSIRANAPKFLLAERQSWGRGSFHEAWSLLSFQLQIPQEALCTACGTPHGWFRAAGCGWLTDSLAGAAAIRGQWMMLWFSESIFGSKVWGHAAAFTLILKLSSGTRGRGKREVKLLVRGQWKKRQEAMFRFLKYDFSKALTKVSKDVRPLVFWGFHGSQEHRSRPYHPSPLTPVFLSRSGQEMKFAR